ncbi:FadR/GntR family transcriptional regulator [Tropicimonas isoalkanivorans]|uniref:DNA-binding transcriptional regulator, FadR family n=1 Tax=Tropicimonas isoalkanivorans TaxID=441112 RepID=A0A1I1Q3B9_9RHOB|nr:FCD domain-containing protein [Tropicimonas isoalkanivorans]SFD16477.1 DNA-binding transcriptional regulator, FadR family [Tropicimonas isoalkanivorans]
MVDIRNLIRDNRLRVGDVLPSENALAAQLGISRTVAREALRGLAALRILEVGSGRRARVAGATSETLSAILDHTAYTRQLSVVQIQDVRRTLEMRTVSLAALHRSAEEAQALLQTIEGMMEAVQRDNPHSVMDLDIRFHEIIARASGNPLYSVLVDSFRVITRQTWHIGWRARGSHESRVENIKCHERIATAVIEQDAARAEAAMAEHFDSSFMVLMRAGVS